MTEIDRRHLVAGLTATAGAVGLSTGQLAAQTTLTPLPAPAAPPTPRASRRVTAPDGVAISAHEYGNPDGPAILFIHGYMQCHLSWSKQMADPAMASRFRMISYDLRGHGMSDKPNEEAAYKDHARWANEVQAVIDAFALRRPVLVGWSYAGRVMSDYLMIHGASRIAGVNYVGAITSNPTNQGAPAARNGPGRLSDDMAVNLTATMDFVRMCFEKQPTADEFAMMIGFNMMVPNHARRFAIGRPTPYEETLKALRLPVLVTHGRKDMGVLIAAGEYTARTIPGAQASWYEDCGHATFWEDAPRFNRELAAFVTAANRG